MFIFYSNKMDTSKYGVRSFNTYQNTCYDCYSPVPMGIPTHIDVTHKENDVNLINKSWLNVDFELKWSVDKDIELANKKETYDQDISGDVKNPVGNLKSSTYIYNDEAELFIGWKNAAECIRRVEVWNGDRDTGYVHVDNDMETFITFTKYATREDKRENRTSHTIFSDLDKRYQQCCGVKKTLTHVQSDIEGDDAMTDPYSRYILYKFPAGTYTEKFNICIPLTEIPALRYFKEFPGCFGPITLKITFDDKALVYYLKHSELKHDLIGHRFYIMNQKNAQYVKHMGAALKDQTNDDIADPEDVLFKVESLTATAVSCDIQGYNISSEGKSALTQEFTAETPYVVPCLYSTFKNFDGRIQGGLFMCDFEMWVRNIKDIHLAFPTDTLQRTVFKNPMLKNLQMRIQNVLYPKIPFNTYDKRFFKIQVNSFDPDRDYMNSLLELPWNIAREMYNPQCNSDDTACIITIPMERDNEPNAFDGFETGNENVNFQLMARIYSQEVAKCVYGLREDSNGDLIDEPSPYIWFTAKTFWTADVTNGLVFHQNETPNY